MIKIYKYHNDHLNRYFVTVIDSSMVLYANHYKNAEAANKAIKGLKKEFSDDHSKDIIIYE